MQLTEESFKKLWNNELLPSIRKEIAKEIDGIKMTMKSLIERCMNIEKSQEFLTHKYDEIAETLQIIKKQNTVTENKIKKQEKDLLHAQENIDDLYQQLDELQQYSRRDCLEITGIPKVNHESPNQLIVELGEIIGVNIQPEDISIAHRLPDTKTNKDRLIVKFVKRSTKDDLYQKRSQLATKSTKDLPSMNVSGAKYPKTRIHINESLTTYRRRLLGKINQFKKETRYKFLWTVNGKILLKEREGTQTLGPFITDADFEDFKKSL